MHNVTKIKILNFLKFLDTNNTDAFLTKCLEKISQVSIQLYEKERRYTNIDIHVKLTDRINGNQEAMYTVNELDLLLLS